MCVPHLRYQWRENAQQRLVFPLQIPHYSSLIFTVIPIIISIIVVIPPLPAFNGTRGCCGSENLSVPAASNKGFLLSVPSAI